MKTQEKNDNGAKDVIKVFELDQKKEKKEILLRLRRGRKR